MAKLSAHGYELARVTRSLPDDEDGYFVEQRLIYSFRSDGHILRNHKARDKYGAPQDWGWKLWRRFKPEIRQSPARLEHVVTLRVQRMLADWDTLNGASHSVQHLIDEERGA